MLLKFSRFLLLSFLLPTTMLAYQCPYFNVIWVNDNWVSSYEEWSLLGADKASTQDQSGLLDVAIYYNNSEGSVSCHFTNGETRSIYKKIFNPLSLPSAQDWLQYDDGSWHCNNSNILVCSF